MMRSHQLLSSWDELPDRAGDGAVDSGLLIPWKNREPYGLKN